MKEVRPAWMDEPSVPDPEDKAIAKCRVKRMTGVSIENYTDYGPFRRCAKNGCKQCQRIVKKYDGVPKAERKHPRASSKRGIPAHTRDAIVAMIKHNMLSVLAIAEKHDVTIGVVQGIKKRVQNGDLY